MNKNIHILTGPVRSGKTTRLIAWLRFHENCAGILSPVIDEKRYVYSIHHEQEMLLESNQSTRGQREAFIGIGRYTFLASAFAWARSELQAALSLNPRWLIIDEIGPLELAGKGLEPMVSTVLEKYERTHEHQLILVIRENMLDEVVSHYHLEGQYLLDESFLEIT